MKRQRRKLRSKKKEDSEKDKNERKITSVEED